MTRVKELKNKLILTAMYTCILIVFWSLHIPCLFEHFLKIPCPGCGMSQAVFCALRFDFPGAFSSHPMFWSMPILYVYFLIDFERLRNKVLHYIVLCGIAVGFCINWLGKFC